MATSDCCSFLHDFCDALIKDTESSVLWNENSSYHNVYHRKLPIGQPLSNWRILSQKWDEFQFVERKSQPRASLAAVPESCPPLQRMKDGKLQILYECTMQQIPRSVPERGFGVLSLGK